MTVRLRGGRLVWRTGEIAETLGVRPATVRDWVRRGLLRAAGGTVGRPLYDLKDARRAQRSAKPRRDTPTDVLASGSSADHSSARTTVPNGQSFFASRGSAVR